MNEDFNLENVWNCICQTVPGDTIVEDVSNILSNRQENRWIMIFDMNFCTSNPSLISRFNNFIKQFPPERNLSPFVIFTSIDQYEARLIDSKPVQLLTIFDWQMDYFLKDPSKLGMYANLKSTRSKPGAGKIKEFFKKLGIIMKEIKVTKKKFEALTAALSMFLFLGLSGGVLFNHRDLLGLILKMKFELNMVVLSSIFEAFFSAKLFSEYVLQDKKGESTTIRSLKCPNSVATVIRKVNRKRDIKKLLEKLLGLSGKVAMKRWLFDLIRGEKDNPIAKRCKMAVSERKRSGSIAVIGKVPTDGRLMLESSNRKVRRKLNPRVRVSNSTDGSSLLQGGDNPLESLNHLAQETKELGNQLGLNHPNTLNKSVDFIRAQKYFMEQICKAIHPNLVEQLGRDHQATEFVKSLLPPVVVTLDED